MKLFYHVYLMQPTMHMQKYLQSALDILFPPSPEHMRVRNIDPDSIHTLTTLRVVKGAYVLMEFAHEDVRALIHEAKFHSNVRAQKLLGSIVCSFFSARPLPTETTIIPVPLSKKRTRARGYNQVTEILRYACPEHANIRIAHSALARVKDTKPQTTLSKDERLRNMDDAFVVRNPDSITGAHVMLVDDVLTTGATLRAAQEALAEHHPASLIPIALAH